MIATHLYKAEAGSVAVIDIDSTIMDTAHRNRAIIEAAAQVFHEIAAVVARWDWTRPLRDPLAAVAAEARLTSGRERALRQYWEERFFSNEWLRHDCPYPGAATFVRWLLDQGISIVYLTGRDERRMATGTRASFRAHGLPTESPVTFVFKQDAGETDLAFKRMALSRLSTQNPIALCLENEPENANMMRQTCPDALILLIETVTMDDPPPVHRGVHTFRVF